MTFDSYSGFWDQQATTRERAIAAVDGSAGEEIVRLTGQWSARLVRKALDLKGNEQVLELGCGVGRIGRELVPHCAYWHGADISANMLKVARERLAGLENVEFSKLHRTSLDMFEDGRFDHAYSVAVFCHLDKEDLFLYLQELHRILKRNGLIYVETWNLAHPIGWKRWRLEVDQWARSDHNQRKDVARNQFCAPEEFSLYLQGAGFREVVSYTASPWIQAIAAKKESCLDLEAIRAELKKEQGYIAYSPLFSELFGELLDVLGGLKQPQELLALLEEKGPSEEVMLYRHYLEALWASQQELRE